MRDNEELERLILARSAHLQTILETARQQIRRGEGISHEDFWQEMEEDKPVKGRRKAKAKIA